MAFKKGQSGNPAGRRPDKSREQARESLLKWLPKGVKKVQEMADAGDQFALKLVLDKTMPNARPAHPLVAIKIPPKATLLQKAEAIQREVLGGRVNSTHGAELMDLLLSHAKIIESENLAAEVVAMREKLESLVASQKDDFDL